jgi:hypothetical protein
MTALYKVNVETTFVVQAEDEEEALQFIKDSAIPADVDTEDEELPWDVDGVLFRVERYYK